LCAAPLVHDAAHGARYSVALAPEVRSVVKPQRAKKAERGALLRHPDF
jgi:hypothetical protein